MHFVMYIAVSPGREGERDAAIFEFEHCAIVNSRIGSLPWYTLRQHNAILEFEDCVVAVVYIAPTQLERFYATPKKSKYFV